MSPRRERSDVVLRARALRRDMTLPEGLFWRELRQRPGGFKFRRQHPFGRCIVDFYCPAIRLVVEVDGMSHEMGGRPNQDLRRDEWLREQGPHIMRFAATDVLQDMNSIVAAILSVAENLPLHHAPHGSPPHDAVAGRN